MKRNDFLCAVACVAVTYILLALYFERPSIKGWLWLALAAGMFFHSLGLWAVIAWFKRRAKKRTYAKGYGANLSWWQSRPRIKKVKELTPDEVRERWPG